MKKILFVTGGSDSGSEHNLFSFLEKVNSEEAEVSVLTRYNDYNNLHSIKCDHYFSEENFLNSRGLIDRIAERAFYKGKYFPFIRFYKRILKLVRPDLIYCNQLTIPESFDFFFDTDIPLIVHSHSLQQFLYGYPFVLLEKRLKKAALLLSCSEAQKAVLHRLVPGLDVRVLYPPINMEELGTCNLQRKAIRQRWSISEDATVWAMASTYFNYNKDPDRFIEIGQRILSAGNTDAYFVWIGGSPESTALRYAFRKLSQLGIASHFIFTGDCSHTDYIQYLDASDGLMLVSLEESFSIVTAEAIALGKPVVAFECGGVSEIINQDNGCLVPPYSFDLMASMVIKVMKEKGKYEKKKMWDSVSHFDIEFQSAVWKELILNLIKPGVVR